MIILLINAFFPTQLSAENPDKDRLLWSASLEASTKFFIENKGQFDGRNNLPNTDILFGIDQSELQIYFTKKGVTYRFDKKLKNPNREKGDTTRAKYVTESDFIHVVWEETNPDVIVRGEEKSGAFHTYAIVNRDRSVNAITGINGFKKLIYQNLYPGIDLEYEFHPVAGIKYSLILHPGADVAQFRMKVADDREIKMDTQGNLIIPTSLGNIIEHAPMTFYSDNESELISSRFVKTGKSIDFELGSYDPTKTIIIDPWVQTPPLPNSNGVWECELDASGNVYIIGGDMPMKLQKYNAAGALQWTYNTPWDTTNNWLGTIATDKVGNSYITSGSTAAIQKVNTNGGLGWDEDGWIYDEYWTIDFNCDQTKLLVGGTRLNNGINDFNGVIFDIDVDDGMVDTLINVADERIDTIFFPGGGSFPQIFPDEVRAITSAPGENFYYLTLDSLGAISLNSRGCSPDSAGMNLLFSIESTYQFGYKSESYRPKNGNSGICAIRANDRFVYSQNGVTVHKRSLATGAILAGAAIPGGIDSTDNFFGHKQPGNSGIDIDSCGNVYVGSSDRVIKYDADLNILDSALTQFRVFDVAVSQNGEIIVAGATGDAFSSGARTGYVQSIDMAACQPMDRICCDTIDCAEKQFIHLDAGWNLISSYIIPDNPDMLDVIADISFNILLVKDASGKTAIPSLGINTIGNWDVTKGYKIKTTSLTTLEMGCTQVDPITTSVPLSSGWNIIAYLRDSNMPINNALASISSNILLVKNNAGETYLPSLGINNIGDMIPGQGYKIKTSNATTLLYPQN